MSGMLESDRHQLILSSVLVFYKVFPYASYFIWSNGVQEDRVSLFIKRGDIIHNNKLYYLRYSF